MKQKIALKTKISGIINGKCNNIDNADENK
jgi:hypothetical protein